MRSSRLLSILLRLQLRGRVTALALAREFEVAVRTIYRDIDQLSAAGVPVYGERGRSGGFQLVQGGGGVQRRQLVLPALQQRRQFGRRAAVAARQAHPGAQPGVQLGQAFGVGLAAAQVGVQGVGRVFELRCGAAQRGWSSARRPLLSTSCWRAWMTPGGMTTGRFCAMRLGEWPPRSLTACSSLPPEGAAAPADWQSQIRGPCWIEEPPKVACVNPIVLSLPKERRMSLAVEPRPEWAVFYGRGRFAGDASLQ